MSSSSSSSLAEQCLNLLEDCRKGKGNIMREFLSKGGTINFVLDENSRTALHYCSENIGWTITAADILRSAPELISKTDSDGLTPLHMAVINGNVGLTRLFLNSKNCPMNVKNGDGFTALHLAVIYQQIECLQYLLKRGEIDRSPRDQRGATPLHYAVGNQIDNEKRSQMLDILLECGANFNAKDSLQRTPLLWAASMGCIDSVKNLLQHGADPDANDITGLTALHCAANEGFTQIMQILLDDFQANIAPLDYKKRSPLFYCSSQGHAETVDALLKRLQSHTHLINHQDEQGRTALHCAATKNHVSVTSELLKAGADARIVSKFGESALHEATHQGHIGCVRILLIHSGTMVNNLTLAGRSPLHVAVRKNQIDLVKLIVNHHAANVNIVGYSKQLNKHFTPLDLTNNKSECFTFLLSRGAKSYQQLQQEEEEEKEKEKEEKNTMMIDNKTLPGSLTEVAIVKEKPPPLRMTVKTPPSRKQQILPINENNQQQQQNSMKNENVKSEKHVPLILPIPVYVPRRNSNFPLRVISPSFTTPPTSPRMETPTHQSPVHVSSSSLPSPTSANNTPVVPSTSSPPTSPKKSLDIPTTTTTSTTTPTPLPTTSAASSSLIPFIEMPKIPIEEDPLIEEKESLLQVEMNETKPEDAAAATAIVDNEERPGSDNSVRFSSTCTENENATSVATTARSQTPSFHHQGGLDDLPESSIVSFQLDFGNASMEEAQEEEGEGRGEGEGEERKTSRMSRNKTKTFDSLFVQRCSTLTSQKMERNVHGSVAEYEFSRLLGRSINNYCRHILSSTAKFSTDDSFLLFRHQSSQKKRHRRGRSNTVGRPPTAGGGAGKFTKSSPHKQQQSSRRHFGSLSMQSEPAAESSSLNITNQQYYNNNHEVFHKKKPIQRSRSTASTPNFKQFNSQMNENKNIQKSNQSPTRTKQSKFNQQQQQQQQQHLLIKRPKTAANRLLAKSPYAQPMMFVAPI